MAREFVSLENFRLRSIKKNTGHLQIGDVIGIPTSNTMFELHTITNIIRLGHGVQVRYHDGNAGIYGYENQVDVYLKAIELPFLKRNINFKHRPKRGIFLNEPKKLAEISEE